MYSCTSWKGPSNPSNPQMHKRSKVKIAKSVRVTVLRLAKARCKSSLMRPSTTSGNLPRSSSATLDRGLPTNPQHQPLELWVPHTLSLFQLVQLFPSCLRSNHRGFSAFQLSDPCGSPTFTDSTTLVSSFFSS